jgi:FkbM family methyltransferase
MITRSLATNSANFLRTIKHSWQATQSCKSIWHSMPVTLLFHLTNNAKLLQNRVFRFCWQTVAFSAQHTDYVTINEVLLNQEYKFLLPILATQPAPQIIIDSGANIGLFSIYVLAACPQAEIHAIEASRKTFSLLAHNRDLNKYDRWHVYHAALWERDGEVRFTDMESSISSHIEFVQQRNIGHTDSVPAVRLRTFIGEHIKSSRTISLLKLDIEGSEEVVLNNSEDVLPQVANLLVEIHPEYVNKRNVENVISKHFPYVYHIKASNRRPYIFASRTPHSTLSTA